jgi:hypothetical protein
MDVRIARVGTWQNPTSQKEETKAEIIATCAAKTSEYTPGMPPLAELRDATLRGLKRA